MPMYTHTCSNDDCQTEYEVEITYFSPEIPGKYDGPWEDCYPTEPAEVETAEAVCPKCGKVEDRDDIEAEAMEVMEDRIGDMYGGYDGL